MKIQTSVALLLVALCASVLPHTVQAQATTTDNTYLLFERIQERIDARIERALQRIEERLARAEERICTRYAGLQDRYGIELPAFCEEGSGTPARPVALTFSANPGTIATGATSTLMWNALYADTCLASGGWTGTRVASGTAAVSPATSTEYSLACANERGTTSRTIMLTVTGTTTGTSTGTTSTSTMALPTVDLSADPQTVTATGTAPASTTLTWSSTNANSCIATNAWSGSRATTGSSTVTVNATSTYALACANERGTTTDSVTVGFSRIATSGSATTTSATTTTATTTPATTTPATTTPATTTPATTTPATTTVATGSVHITEVLYRSGTTSAWGEEPENEWVELWNSGSSTVDLRGWTLRDDSATRTLATTTRLLAPGGYVLVTPATSTDEFWTLPTGTAWLVLSMSIGNGLDNDGDSVRLYRSDGTLSDSVRWGTSTTSAPVAPEARAGEAIYRTNMNTSTGTAPSWATTSAPTPGE